MGYDVLETHSKKSQKYRERISEAFRNRKGVIMFTSDVSARGLDYPDVTLVVQVTTALLTRLSWPEPPPWIYSLSCGFCGFGSRHWPLWLVTFPFFDHGRACVETSKAVTTGECGGQRLPSLSPSIAVALWALSSIAAKSACGRG